MGFMGLPRSASGISASASSKRFHALSKCASAASMFSACVHHPPAACLMLVKSGVMASLIFPYAPLQSVLSYISNLHQMIELSYSVMQPNSCIRNRILAGAQQEVCIHGMQRDSGCVPQATSLHRILGQSPPQLALGAHRELRERGLERLALREVGGCLPLLVALCLRLLRGRARLAGLGHDLAALGACFLLFCRRPANATALVCRANPYMWKKLLVATGTPLMRNMIL